MKNLTLSLLHVLIVSTEYYLVKIISGFQDYFHDPSGDLIKIPHHQYDTITLRTLLVIRRL